jgi:hypothetical protein
MNALTGTAAYPIAPPPKGACDELVRSYAELQVRDVESDRGSPPTPSPPSVSARRTRHMAAGVARRHVPTKSGGYPPSQELI